jgi:hypothetical protein
MNKGGFSWRKLLGISAAKAKISRSIGIPLTKSGRQQKVGRIVMGKGCLVSILIELLIPISFAALIKLIL